MDTTRWLALVRAFPERLSKIDRTVDDGMSTAMFALWLLMRQAPSTDLALYERISEAALSARADEVTPLLRKDAFGFAPGPVADAHAAVLAVGAHLRALDLLAGDLHNGAIAHNPAEKYRVAFARKRGFVIPVERQLWRTRVSPEKDCAPFAQRGAVKHRILPAEIDGAAVKPYRGHWPSGDRTTSRFGAVLFPGLEFLEETDERTFLVTGVTCARLNKVVDQALENSHVEACVATMFPELTIDDATLVRIKASLRSKPWLEAEKHGGAVGRTPAIVVAGSWHREEGGKHFNFTPVVDGDGRRVLEHRKRKAYKDPRGLYEKIEPGGELPVLVFDHCLFAFGICLDFCDRRYHQAYDDLAVDLVLVPSCGHDGTMMSHIKNAEQLTIRRKSRTMVVQQLYPRKRAKLGYVLPPEPPIPPSPVKAEQKQAWATFHTHFSDTR